MPTMKQRKSLKNLSENVGSIGKAMKKAGYSESTCKTPQRLTESKGWKELLDENLSELSLTQEHKKVLLQDKDLGNKMKAVDIGYKLRKKYDDKGDININLIGKIYDPIRAKRRKVDEADKVLSTSESVEYPGWIEEVHSDNSG